MTVAIEFRCNTCGKLLRTGEENAGRPAACPSCGDRIAVPAPTPTAPPAADAHDPTPSALGSTPFASAPARHHTLRPHRGGLVLAFGILAWATCFLFGVAAWAMGVEDLRAMRAGDMDPSGEGLTKAGMLLGAINVIIVLVALLGMIGVAGLAVVFDA